MKLGDSWMRAYKVCIICNEDIKDTQDAEPARRLGIIPDRMEPMFAHTVCLIRWRRKHAADSKK